MLVRSKNNSNDEIDYLAIGQKEYRETNPFGYNDYKEKSDGWWKTVEYTNENGEKVVKDINPLGQVLIHRNMTIRENTNKKEKLNLDDALSNDQKKNPPEKLNLDDALLDDWDFDNNQQEIKNKQCYNWDDTPEPEPDEINLSENDFYKMDWKKAQYQIYRLLVNISSSLSNIQEVAKQNDKAM